MERQQATFGGDLGASLSAWRSAPGLPLITVAIGVVFALPDVLGPGAGLLALPAAILLAGWVGTQRIWYLRLFRGQALEPGDLLPMTWAFTGRFLALGFLVGIPFAVLYLPLLLLVHDRGGRALAVVPLVFVADFLLTFVTSALAFSTRDLAEAGRIGWRTLWDRWPQTAPYALVAPLVVIGLGQTLGRVVGGVGALALSLVGLLLALLCKGATSAYYLRQHRVGDNGAA